MYFTIKKIIKPENMTFVQYNQLRKEDNRDKKMDVSQCWVSCMALKHTRKTNSDGKFEYTPITGGKRNILVSGTSFDIIVPYVIYGANKGSYETKTTTIFKIKEINEIIPVGLHGNIINPLNISKKTKCINYLFVREFDWTTKKNNPRYKSFFQAIEKVYPDLKQNILPKDNNSIIKLDKLIRNTSILVDTLFEDTIYYKLVYIQALYNEFKGIVFSKTLNISQLNKDDIMELRKVVINRPWDICLSSFRKKFNVDMFDPDNIKYFVSYWMDKYYKNLLSTGTDQESVEAHKDGFRGFSIASCIISVLKDASENQCSYVPYKKLISETTIKLLNLELKTVPKYIIDHKDNVRQKKLRELYQIFIGTLSHGFHFMKSIHDAILKLAASRDLCIINTKSGEKKMDNVNIYLLEIYEQTTGICKAMGKIYKNIKQMNNEDSRFWMEEIAEAQKKTDKKLNEKQLHFVKTCLGKHEHPIHLLSGRAGAGKTETSKSLVRTFLKRPKNNVLLCGFQGSTKDMLYKKIVQGIVPPHVKDNMNTTSKTKDEKNKFQYKSLVGCMTIHKFVTKCTAMNRYLKRKKEKKSKKKTVGKSGSGELLAGIPLNIITHDENEDEKTITESHEYYNVETMDMEKFIGYMKNLKWVVVDEIGNISLSLFFNLIKNACKTAVGIICVGDEPQILSISLGNIMNDILDSFGVHPDTKGQLTELTENNRFNKTDVNDALLHNMNLLYDDKLSLYEKFKVGRNETTSMVSFVNTMGLTKLCKNIINIHLKDKAHIQFYNFKKDFVKIVNSEISEKIPEYRCFTDIPGKFKVVDMHISLLKDSVKQNIRLQEGKRLLCRHNTNPKTLTNCFLLEEAHYKALIRTRQQFTSTGAMIKILMCKPKLVTLVGDYCSNGTLDIIHEMRFGCQFFGKGSIKKGATIAQILKTHAILPITVYKLDDSKDMIIQGAGCIEENNLTSGISMTINKMQGKQKKICVFIIPSGINVTYFGYDVRKLLVALTRAREKLYILIGSNSLNTGSIHYKKLELNEAGRLDALKVFEKIVSDSKSKDYHLTARQVIQLIALNNEPPRISDLSKYLLESIKQNKPKRKFNEIDDVRNADTKKKKIDLMAKKMTEIKN